MKAPLASQFIAALIGGLVVAGTLLLLGVTGPTSTETVFEQGAIPGQPASSSAALTPNAIYQRDAPGVVFVRAQIIQQVEDPFQLFPEQQSSISTGSGFLINSLGLILTNYHVIEGADRGRGVSVQFEDNVARRAAVVDEDPSNDLALLRVDMTGVPSVKPLVLGDSTRVRVGDPTLAIGNPFGLDRTLTSGIVSALQRQIQAPNGFSIDNVIQTDAPINPGNSGGPLLDASGQVIGINSQIETGGNGTGSVGIGFAIPINTAKKLLPQLEAGGQVKTAYLGVTGANARGGVLIEAAQPGGPAASAGLRRGDQIEGIAGHRVSTMDQVLALVEARLPGQRLQIEIHRGSRVLTVVVMLGTRPPVAP
jgi:S1-C subfamily serine protease